MLFSRDGSAMDYTVTSCRETIGIFLTWKTGVLLVTNICIREVSRTKNLVKAGIFNHPPGPNPPCR